MIAVTTSACNEVIPAMTEPRIVERALPIRTYDIDFAGIVSNIVYVRWLEDLRLAMMEEAYPIAMGRVKWHLAAEFVVGDAVHARAEQIGLFMRLSTRRPIAPPLPLRQRFAPEPG
jgi:acyl-CoA thioester hydrolase